MRIDTPRIQMIADAIRAECGDDEDMLLDCLEGETDLFEIVRALLDANEEDEGSKAALAAQMEARKMRRDRCDKRIDARRKAIASLMQAAGVAKIPLPEATVSLREVKAKLAIGDPEAVPHEYCKQVWKPEMAKINEAWSADATPLPNWLRVVPAGHSISVRSK